MNKRSIALFSIAIVAAVAILFPACRKINESTELGAGVIPQVDNINTFDTVLTVQAFNDTFGLANDSQYLGRNEEYFLGRINNDPFFGKTDAQIFLELKPSFFPYYFLDRPDSLRLDSVVLVLDYVETYGDTNTAQTIEVYEMDQNNNFTSDSLYLIRKNNFTLAGLLGSKTIIPRTLNDSVKAFRDTAANQLRVRLSDAFGDRILDMDSTGNGGFVRDSLFRDKIRGLAIKSTGPGNAVMGFNLAGVNTKLAIYYRYNDGGGPASFDTTVDYFTFHNHTAAANSVKRDYAGTPVEASLMNGTIPDPMIYIQNTPGTFATLKIPDLLTLTNRTVHRAELIVEQNYDISDSLFRPPDFLYLDAIDPSITRSNYKFRTIPYDLAYTSAGQLNLAALGVGPVISTNPQLQKVRTWKFNISRYVQHILTRTQSLYDLRLFAPFAFNEQFGIPPGQDQTISVVLNPAIVKGRVRLFGNTGPNDPNPQKIRLRIIYSKL